MLQSRDATIQTLQQQIEVLKHQLDWFKRQLFGQKSERLAPLPDRTQLHLGEMMPLPATPAAELSRTVPAYTRRIAQRDLATDSEAVPFFDASRVRSERTVAITYGATAKVRRSVPVTRFPCSRLRRRRFADGCRCGVYRCARRCGGATRPVGHFL